MVNNFINFFLISYFNFLNWYFQNYSKYEFNVLINDLILKDLI